jgi:hypothetical protein
MLCCPRRWMSADGCIVDAAEGRLEPLQTHRHVGACSAPVRAARKGESRAISGWSEGISGGRLFGAATGLQPRDDRQGSRQVGIGAAMRAAEGHL